VWGYTLKQAVAYLYLAEQRKKRNAAEQLQLSAIAASGDGKSIQRVVKKLLQGLE